MHKMRLKTTILFLLFTIPAIVVGQNLIREKLIKTVDQSWIKTNPEFQKINTSFFTSKNVDNYFVSSLQIGGSNKPFIWDDNFLLYDFLLQLSSDTSIIEGKNADEYYEGTKIHWNQDIQGLVHFENEIYELTIDEWYLIKNTECIGTITFPTVAYKQSINLEIGLLDDLFGLSIIPKDKSITKIASEMVSLKTIEDIDISGTGYDLNDDKIIDVFVYYEEIDDSTGYRRLYQNIDGKWICKWIEYYEICN